MRLNLLKRPRISARTPCERVWSLTQQHGRIFMPPPDQMDDLCEAGSRPGEPQAQCCPALVGRFVRLRIRCMTCAKRVGRTVSVSRRAKLALVFRSLRLTGTVRPTLCAARYLCGSARRLALPCALMAFAIVEGRAGEELLKGLGEVAMVVEADGERDVCDGAVGLLQ